MFLSLYIFVTFILITNLTVCLEWNSNRKISASDGSLQNKNNALLRFRRNVKKSVNNKEPLDILDEAKLFENIYETIATTLITTETTKVESKRKDDLSINEIKDMLSKLLEKVNVMETQEKRESSSGTTTVVTHTTTNIMETQPLLSTYHTSNFNGELNKRNHFELLKSKRWGKWTDWSVCSVTCGKGREIRWRHCLESCDEAETEMEEKTCQLPACGPGKIFGIQL